MTRTEKLEAALRHFVNGYPNNEWRGLLHEEGCPGVRSRRSERDEEWPCRCDGDVAEDDVEAALYESGPSCCEETRERTLKEAAELCFHEEISSGCQFCSNYVVVLPMDAPGKPCGHESPSGAAKCELESGHQGTHIGSAKEGNTVRWLPPTTPPQANKGATNPAPAIPVKPACTNPDCVNGLVENRNIPEWWSCPKCDGDCGGEEP